MRVKLLQWLRMRTSDTSLWDALWKKDVACYDPSALSAAVEEESTGVRCQKITRYLDRYLGDLAGKRTIEVGCGGGIYSMIFARLGARVTLLDYSPDALMLAERNLGALNLEGELMRVDAFNLPSDFLGKYDVAMSFGTVEHYRYPRRLDICRAHVDLVKPGGVVIISTPNIFFLPHEILKVLLSMRRKWFLGYEGSFSRHELRRVGRKLSLHDLQIVGSSWLADLRRYAWIMRDTQTFRRWFSWGGRSHLVTTSRPQTHQWLDDYLGHDIALLGSTSGLEQHKLDC